MLVAVPCFHSLQDIRKQFSSLGLSSVNNDSLLSLSYSVGVDLDTCTVEFESGSVHLQGNSAGWFTTIKGKSQVLDGSFVQSLWAGLAPHFPMPEVASAVWTYETPLRIYVRLLRDYIAVPMQISVKTDWGIENQHVRGSFIVASPYETMVDTLEMNLEQLEKLFRTTLRGQTHQLRVTDENTLRIESTGSSYAGGVHIWDVKGKADRLLKKLGVPHAGYIEGWIHDDIGYWLLAHGPVQVFTYEVPGELRASC